MITFFTCLMSQWLGDTITGKNNLSSLKSAWISSLSITLMLRANLWWVFVLASVLTVGSKFLIKRKGKHVFNPTNFGIVISVLLSGNAWISPGQWGSDYIWWAFMGISGLTVLFQVGRWDTAFTFLAALAVFEFSRNVLWLGWPVDFFIHQFSSGTLLLFTFFMITDPVTTPSHRLARVLWSIVIAGLSAWLNWKYLLPGAPLYALFVMSAFTPLFDIIFKAKKFKWIQS